MTRDFVFTYNGDTSSNWKGVGDPYDRVSLNIGLQHIRDLISSNYAIPLTAFYTIIFGNSDGDFWNCMGYFIPKQLLDSIKWEYDPKTESYTVKVTAMRWDDRVIFEDSRIQELIEEGKEECW